jgi:16S rRNA (guanine527-N7)-methyltransferase
LKAVIDTLRLNGVEAVHSRAEEVGQDPDYRETFDIVLTRAVAKINVLCEYTLPLIKDRRHVFMFQRALAQGRNRRS